MRPVVEENHVRAGVRWRRREAKTLREGKSNEVPGKKGDGVPYAMPWASIGR
jgi:hypothetical protein